MVDGGIEVEEHLFDRVDALENQFNFVNFKFPRLFPSLESHEVEVAERVWDFDRGPSTNSIEQSHGLTGGVFVRGVFFRNGLHQSMVSVKNI